MQLKTGRLLIRSFQAEDINDVYAIYRDPAVCRFLLHEPWNEPTKQAEFARKLTQNDLTAGPLSLACLLGETVIGDISIWRTGMPDSVEIGYVFHPGYSGRGYATEALRAVIGHLFYEQKIHRIQANMDARNTASARLCQSLGMRREAHFLQDYWNKGEWTDSYVYGMLASDLPDATK